VPGSKVFFPGFFAVGGIHFALGGVLFFPLADENSMPRGWIFSHKPSRFLFKNYYWYNYLLVYLIFFYHFGWSSRKLFIWQHWPLCSPARPSSWHKYFQFLIWRWAMDGIWRINNNYFPAISRVLYHSTETISQPPQSHETIPLKRHLLLANW
jgi:hypothetical protein